jgi:Rod binding domain-containing protein
MQVPRLSPQADTLAGTNAPSSKLVKSAQEFEAILLQSWLEKMSHSFVGSPESQDAAHDTINSLSTQAVATALAGRGGIGIAAMLVRQLQSHGEGLSKGAMSRVVTSGQVK